MPEGAGRVVGGFTLIEQIGEGAFGTVWLAEQREPVQRRVALKILKAGFDTRDVVGRFEAERQALAVLDHPYIAGVLDGGTTDEGRPWFAMEHVDGVPITDFCDARRLTLSERLELFVEVCQAVQHAHQKGIVHRDLKPGNVLVTVHEDRPTPKVIDFGIAKAIGARLTEETLATEIGQIVGTPDYMSPEQAAADADVDTRADIYGLGVILYELLVGARPFDLKAALEKGYLEVIRTIREVDPDPPSTRLRGRDDATASKRAREMAGDLDHVAMKALRKDREERYVSAGAFAEDLERWLRGMPVEASVAMTVVGRARRFVARHRAGVAVGAAAALMLLVGVGVAVGGFLEARTSADEAEASRAEAVASSAKAERSRVKATMQRERAQHEASRAKRVVAMMLEVLGYDPQELGARDRAATEPLRAALDEVAGTLPVRLENEPDVAATIRAALVRGYATIGAWPEAVVQARAVSNLLDELGAADTSARRLGIRLVLAERTRLEGDLERAGREVREVEETNAGQERSIVVRALLARARIARDRGEVEQARTLAGRAVEEATSAAGPDALLTQRARGVADALPR